MHPLHPRVEVYPFESHANSHALLGTGFSYRSNLMILSDHASTHVDSFTHFDPDPDAPTIDRLPLDLFCGEAICLDLSHLPPVPGSRSRISRQRSQRTGSSLSKATSCCSTQATTSVQPARPST